MKKYIGAYGIQFIVLVVLHASKGLPLGWVFWEVDNRQNSIDGRQLTYTLLIINILIIQACLLMTIIVTVKSKIKFKWIILLCMFVYSFLLPIVSIVQIGGVAGGVHKHYMSFISCLIEGISVPMY